MEQLYCLDATPTFLWFFDPSIAPSLLYYAYIPILFISILLGALIYRQKAEFALPNTLFFVITILFGLYILNEILQWIAVPAGLVHFGWQMIAFFFTSLTLLLLYFILVMLRGKDIFFYEKIAMFVLFLPTILLLPTSYNMGSFDLWWCQSTTGPLYFYIYSLAFITSLYIIATGVKYYFLKKSKIVAPLIIGATLFILLLTGSDLYSEYTGEFEFNLIGPLGMVIFIGLLSYLIVTYRVFNLKLIGAQALVLALVAMVGSQLFFVESVTNYTLVSLTLIFSIIGSYLLVRSVKKEIKQREEIEQLAKKLAKANKRLRQLDKAKSEFVSIASHQLRSPLAAMRGYASMLLEGSYGQLPQKAREVLERIADSTKNMALSVEDYLNVSRIESGNMKYELIDFNLADEAKRVVDDKRQEAIKSGLLLTYKSDLTQNSIINADRGKVIQILHNLINNAIKYTPKGSITVFLNNDDGKNRINIDIVDTGVGLTEDELDSLFGKFERAKGANEVNVGGTGLGLFVAKSMAEHMGGTITVTSPGKDQGSTFRVSFPLAA